MKNTCILLLTLFLSMNAFSQRERFENSDKIKALKIAYITEKLDLSTSEAEKFWPVYNAFEDTQDKLRQDAYNKRKNINLESISESEAEQLLTEMETFVKRRHELLIKFTKDLRAIIPAKKIILLKGVEDDFKRKMIKEFRKRRQNMKRERP